MPVVQMKTTSTTSPIKIEKGVPIPDRRGKYPWADMDVGDSFFVATDKVENFRRNVYGKNRNGKKFTARAEGNGVRVWRTA